MRHHIFISAWSKVYSWAMELSQCTYLFKYITGLAVATKLVNDLINACYIHY